MEHTECGGGRGRIGFLLLDTVERDAALLTAHVATGWLLVMYELVQDKWQTLYQGGASERVAHR